MPDSPAPVFHSVDRRHGALCPVSERCGGCPLIGFDYRAQLELKRQRFLSTWQTAGLPALAPQMVAAQRPTRYRNRLRLRIDERGQVGFFNPDKALDCAVAEASVLDGMRRLRDAARRDPLLLGHFAHAEVRARDARGMGGIVLYAHESGAASTLAPQQVRELESDAWCVAATTIGGRHELPPQTWYLDDDVFLLVPLDCFMQVNWPTNSALVAHVVQGLEQRPGRSFADFYMGAGNFALPLLARGFRGAGVEYHAAAAHAAARAARFQEQRFDELLPGDSLAAARTFLAQGRRFDHVIVDPPRGGLKQGAGVFAELARSTLVACSCNPKTLTRDVPVIQNSGFEVSSVTLFDMFPQTNHVEAVVWMDRR